MRTTDSYRAFQDTDTLGRCLSPPQIGQLLRQRWATDRLPRHGAGVGLADLAGFWASSSHATNVSPLHVARHWQLTRI